MPSASPSIIEPTGLAKRPLGSVKILSSDVLLFVVVRSIKSECSEEWCRNAESNRGPTDYESVALPTELSRQIFYSNKFNKLTKYCSKSLLLTPAHLGYKMAFLLTGCSHGFRKPSRI